jgi:hypothetical protein
MENHLDIKKSIKSVVVTGDITVDWNLARIQQLDSSMMGWNAQNLTAACCHFGGAALLAELMTALAVSNDTIQVRQIRLPEDKITPDDIRFPHSYTLWAPYKKDDKSKDSVWRVQEFLGLNPAHRENTPRGAWNLVLDDVSNPDLVVLSDANLGFRDNPQYWPQSLTNQDSQPWILVNTARPVAQGSLWEGLYSSHWNKLIAVMPANDLRSEEIQVSRRLSWESTVQDVLWELKYNPSVLSLSWCAYTVISFGPAGVLLLRKNEKMELYATLFFDTGALEGEWGPQYKGSMIGFNSCLIAGIAREILLNTEQPNIAHGVQKGLQAMRWLQIEGYGSVNYARSTAIQLYFPASQIIQEMSKEKPELAKVNFEAQIIQKSAKGSPDWTILRTMHPGSLDAIAEEIVLKGVERALPDVPLCKFGDLQSVDRREIESLQSINSLIREYISSNHKEPLSIAVFGPPGSGKSFAVKQVARAVARDQIESITFNLSQFNSPDELCAALHQVRDIALKGKIPLVFWDEFDVVFQSQPLGWLRYFLSPMQDGEFQEGQITHPIGRSIFVFAGGTSRSFELFGGNLHTDEEKRTAKLPDFISRLKGFLNIMGPNPPPGEKDRAAIDDPLFIIRRAMLLRSLLARTAPGLASNEVDRQLFSIDPGVLRAFLKVRQYRHGVRSIEAILKMSQLSGTNHFERSSLPAESQLDIHVNGREFTALTNQLPLNEGNIEVMAKSFHSHFCAYLKSLGYVYGDVTSEEKKFHSSLVDFDKLPENEKAQNRANVEDIPRKMSGAGYIMASNRNHELPVEFKEEELEKLAKIEHQRWLVQKMTDNWQWAEQTDKSQKLHKDIKAWNDLSNEAREKDRAMIRAIPDIIASAGYIMFKLD